MRTRLIAFYFVSSSGLFACGSTVDGGQGVGNVASPSGTGTTPTGSPSTPTTTTSGALPPGGIDLGGGVADPANAAPVDLANGGLEMLRSGACGQWQAKTNALPAVLQIVLDTSGSMGMAPQNNGMRGAATKWASTVPALTSAINTLSDTAALGLLFYPGGSSSASALTCVATDNILPIVALGPAGSAARMTFTSAIQATRPSGNTPTHDAYHFALGALQMTTLQGQRFMLLMTDGQPTVDLGCISLQGKRGQPSTPPNTAAIVAEVAAAKAAGVGTFVVGVPGSETERTWLSQAATAGGTATPGCSDNGPTYCHFDMTTVPDFAAGLTAALGAIAGKVASCDYPVPTPPAGQTADPNKVNIVYTPAGVAANAAIIPRNDAPGCTEGWQYNAGNTGITLCSQTCATIKADTSPQVEVFGGCATVQSVLK